jgi:hypothetical protein
MLAGMVEFSGNQLLSCVGSCMADHPESGGGRTGILGVGGDLDNIVNKLVRAL